MCLWLFRSIFIFFEFLASVATRGPGGFRWLDGVVELYSSHQEPASKQAWCTQCAHSGWVGVTVKLIYCTRVEPTTLDSNKKKGIINQLIFG